MIDLHSHILPKLDDGPQTIEESLAMINIARFDGIHTILATPHTLNGIFYNPFSKVVDAVQEVQEAVNQKGIDVKILPGTDAHVAINMVEQIRQGEIGTVNDNNRYVLVEFPPHMVNPGTREELYQLIRNDIVPIITHPERNLAIQKRVEILIEFIAMGCLVQITAMSITGEFGEEAMTSSHRMLEQRIAHIIATDAHSHHYRPPILSSAVKTAAHILENSSEADAMVTDTPAAIIKGEKVEIPEIREPKKKRWWQIL